MKNRAYTRRASNSGFRSDISPRCLARSRMPMTPVTRRPARDAALRPSVSSTDLGIHIFSNRVRRTSRRPMMARLEIGEVSLTTGISEIFRQITFAVMAWNASLTHQFPEKKATHFRQLRCFAQRQRALSVEGNGQLRP